LVVVQKDEEISQFVMVQDKQEVEEVEKVNPVVLILLLVGIL
jgi:hypothetical protein